MSASGMIFFGIEYTDYPEFPWDDHEDGIEDWWRDVKNYKSPFNPYTPDGDYAEGVTEDDPRIEEYFQHRRDWDEANPMPVALHDTSCDAEPVPVLALPGVGLECDWEGAVKFDPSDLVVDERKLDAFNEFMETYNIDRPCDPHWLLTCYQGC